MTFMARFSGTCDKCDGRWRPGGLIRFDGASDDGTPLWGHAVCPDSVDALAHGDACGTCWLVKPCDCEEGDLS